VVKGVNKTVIEIKDTGNKFFEKIVLYVSPEYGSLSTGQLIRAAESLSFDFNRNTGSVNNRSFRKKYRKRQKMKLFLSVTAFCAVICGVLVKIL